MGLEELGQVAWQEHSLRMLWLSELQSWKERVVIQNVTV